ncbi:MAG: molybdopterin-guanine dinucleotide biosynthesis protein B [Lachnospiraceae bacterium]|nr:molybdopterin-guanine dinucleotide biosynthesis protein B [Lachnospiraceae bacterium]
MNREVNNLSVAILAGGKSSRMGQNKALLQINNESIIQRLTNEFMEFDTPIISAAQKGIYEKYSPKVVYDEHREIGPIEGIRQVLIKAEKDYVFVCAADMPFVTKDLVEYMAEYICSDYDCYVIDDGERLQPLCAIYSKKLLPLIESLIAEGKYKLFEIIKGARTKYINLCYTSFEKKIVKNINTKSEYFEAVKPVCFAVSGYKNSGKTFLIEKLINEFINNNYTVATIKHDGHDVLEDVKGTDTYRFFEAGALSSAALTDKRFFMNTRKSVNVKEIIKQITEDVRPDFIILEGFKKSHFPKVEVVRREVYPESVCDKSRLICIATDMDSLEYRDIYDINDVTGIFLCIKKYFGIDEC